MSASAEEFSRKVASWSDLAELIEHFSYYNGHEWLFRGIADVGHGLLPKIGREKTRKLKDVPGSTERKRVPYRLDDERSVLGMFRQQARAHLQSIPQSELEWLAIAQHFGLPTRLLDWTDSLLVAAWFAVLKGGAKKTDSAICVAKGVRAISLDEPGDPLDLQEPAVYRPPHISPRIAAQGSILMICPQPTREVATSFSARIVIDREVEFTIKKRLNACGINQRHLFPDLAGLTEHLAWMYKNDWLTGYRQRPTSDTVVADGTKDEAVE
ncbi:MAG: FRG domain-containing protein [Thermoanaerobaculia bacterium]